MAQKLALDQHVAVINDPESPTGIRVGAIGEVGESWAYVWVKAERDGNPVKIVYTVKEARKEIPAELESFLNGM